MPQRVGHSFRIPLSVRPKIATALPSINSLLTDGQSKRDGGDANVAAYKLVGPVCAGTLDLPLHRDQRSFTERACPRTEVCAHVQKCTGGGAVILAIQRLQQRQGKQHRSGHMCTSSTTQAFHGFLVKEAMAYPVASERLQIRLSSTACGCVQRVCNKRTVVYVAEKPSPLTEPSDVNLANILPLDAV